MFERRSRMDPPYDIETLKDERGHVEFGWVAPEVLLARFQGFLSADLGKTFAGRLRDQAARARNVQYFGDARLLTNYDIEARSAFVRIVLEYRRVFSAVRLLVGSSDVPAASQSIVVAVGDVLKVITSAHEFENELIAIAPAARQRLLKHRAAR